MHFHPVAVVVALGKDRDPVGAIIGVAAVLLAVAFALWLLNRRRNDKNDDGNDDGNDGK